MRCVVFTASPPGSPTLARQRWPRQRPALVRRLRVARRAPKPPGSRATGSEVTATSHEGAWRFQSRGSLDAVCRSARTHETRQRSRCQVMAAHDLATNRALERTVLFRQNERTTQPGTFRSRRNGRREDTSQRHLRCRSEGHWPRRTHRTRFTWRFTNLKPELRGCACRGCRGRPADHRLGRRSRRCAGLDQRAGLELGLVAFIPGIWGYAVS